MEDQKNKKWDISTLEGFVRNKHGNKYADNIHGPLQSLAWKSDMAYYHACESERIIKEALNSTKEISKKDSSSTAIAKAIFLAASPDSKNQHILAAQFQAEAHIIASAQATHSLCDILSVIVYWSFQLDSVSTKPSLNNLNLFSVNQSLQKLPQHSKTSDLIKIATSSSEFEYLAAYVNTTKHNSLVSSCLSVSFDGDTNNGMRIKEFSRNINPYSNKWSHHFLFVDNYALLQMLITIGNSLNDYFLFL
jgi:hypothetical protein